MKSFRFLQSCALVLPLLTLAAGSASADVKNREKGQVKFEGMLGTMTRMFGGKAASEGIVSTNAVKGSRKATLNDTTGRIVDLQEEKVYDLDMKKKEYTVTTFAELRKKLQEAQAKYAATRRSQVSTGDRSAKIRTYNFPQGRVTDHRINFTLHRLPDVIEGDLDELSEALRAADVAERLAAAGADGGKAA